MKFIEQLKNQTRQMLKGRYGSDELNLFLLSLTIITTFLSLFWDLGFLFSFICLVPLILAYVRVFSKNISKRYAENKKFLSYFNPIKARVLKYVNRLQHLKTHKYLTCTQCKQSLRVPRGKGKICVTCPKCKTQMHIKS